MEKYLIVYLIFEDIFMINVIFLFKMHFFKNVFVNLQ